MDYPEWVDRVMKAFATQWRETTGSSLIVGLDQHEVELALGVTDDIGREAVGDALRDLASLGLIEARDGRRFRLEQEGRKFPEASLDWAWKQIFAVHVDSEQERFLRELTELSVDSHPHCARLIEIHAKEVRARFGGKWDHDGILWGSAMVSSLKAAGMVREHSALGGYIRAWPTYVGVVRVTKAEPHEWQSMVRDALADWETTNVDFKRELGLDRDSGKAEFVRDVLALANTKSSGRRVLIVGFGDQSREFEVAFDRRVTQERMEQVLTAWAEPRPTIKLTKVPWNEGVAGVVEVFRDPAMLPYLAKKSAGKLKAGIVYVRHGSHTEPATDAERAALIEEGEGARDLRLS